MIDPEADASLAEFIKGWGVQLHQDLVVDPVAQSFFGNAAVPIAVPLGQHKITQDFQGVPIFFPIARSMNRFEPVPEGAIVEFMLATASEQAWGETDMSLIAPSEGAPEPKTPSLDEQDLKGPLNLMAMVTLPETKKAAPPASTDTPAPEPEAGSSAQGVVAIFGDSDFATNQYFSTSANGDLFLNTVSFLAEENDLIAIRPREKGKQTLSLTSAQGNFVVYMSILVMPALPLLLGIYTWLNRRNA
jgi:ABC-type uncharacterized transport system involved in gliding motility auxiliary subunit